MKTPASFPVVAPKVFPFKAGRGNATATIYRTTSRGYDEYKLPYTDAAGRRFHRFSTYDAARAKGNEMLTQLTSGQGDAIMLTGEDRRAFLRAKEVLKPSGVALEMAALQFAEATSILAGASLMEAARFYKTKHPGKLPDKSVENLITEFISAKKDGKRSQRYIEDLNYRLGKFRNAFHVNIARIDGPSIRAFLDGLKLAPRSTNNFRVALISLFEFAKRRRYLLDEWNELESVESIKDKGGAIEIFTPEELAALLTHADPQVVPFLAIGAFAGLRSAEIDRLEWRDVKLDSGNIIVEKGKAKTASRRVVPMLENLKQWIQPHALTTGKVWIQSNSLLYHMVRDTAKAAGVPWKPNALRHSFISYRVADTQNVNQVALEAGNSPQMIFSNYREIVTTADAKRWFSIQPGNANEKVAFLKAT